MSYHGILGDDLCHVSHVVRFLSCVALVKVYLTLWEHTVAWLVEGLCYKPEGRGFDIQ
jgi:hypothetical protein